jgi:hypothetical protein
MKLRIKGNSIRFRLTRSEVDRLAVEFKISEKVEFGDQPLLYCVRCSDEHELTASFKDHTVILDLPKMMVQELVSTDRVGFKGQSGAISLLVEKDFTCLDNVEEDQSDNYPNPLLKT